MRHLLIGALSILACSARAYQVPISDTDDARQTCSGVWGSPGAQKPHIQVSFNAAATGQLALVIYEYSDARYLGIDNDGSGTGENEWDPDEERLFVCTMAAYKASLCPLSSLGQFIVSIPAGQSNDTSIFTTAVRFEEGTSISADGNTATPAPINKGPFNYEIKKTGYYCVGVVPLSATSAGFTAGATTSTKPNATTTGNEPTPVNPDDSDEDASRVKSPAQATPSEEDDTTDLRKRAVTAYKGVIEFANPYTGQLQGGEYPKLQFYGIISFVYISIACAWAYLCYKHRSDLLAVHHYISGTMVFLIIEMLVSWSYYRYLNNNANATMAKPFLVLVSILSAARNSISFFILLLVSMGYSIVRPTLGAMMTRVRILAIMHFFFGLLYAIGIVAIPLETAGIFIFVCVFPLAFTLTAFMMWIMVSLNGTIADLETRKQSYKKQMFTRLYRVLMIAAIVISGFFVVSSMSFSNRLEDDYAPETWQTRWWLLDGFVSTLYLCCFAAIAFMWRPSDNTRRLAMSDELATDEADAEEYEVQTLRRDRLETEEGRDRGYTDEERGDGYTRTDSVVFDIGEDEDDDHSDHGKKGDRKNLESNSTDGEESKLRKDAPPPYDS